MTDKLVITFELYTTYFIDFCIFIVQTFSQLCSFDYSTKTVQIYKAPVSIRDKPRFPYRGLLLGEPIYFVKDTSLYLVSVRMH
jgi:N-acetyl-beta-hexosaminidase